MEARNLPAGPAPFLGERPERIRGSSPNPTRMRGEGRVKPALAILFGVVSVLASFSLVE